MSTTIELQKQTLTKDIFQGLVNNIKPNTDSSIECPSLDAQFKGYSFGIYAWNDNDYKLQVEDFGFGTYGNWTQYVPTQDQLNQLQLEINNELKRLSE